MILDSLTVDPSDLAARTGWVAKPEGLCKGDRCVPVSGGIGAALDATVLAERLAMPLLHDDVTGQWVLGPEGGGRALTTAVAPDLELPDVDGNPFQLASLHGKKVLLVAWASW
jgi:hypothetical protein